jgi:hypothetical protein
MLEYIFFHPVPTQLFVDWLHEQGVPTQSRQDEESYIIEIPDDLDEDLDNAIDTKYEALLEMNEEIMKEEHADEAEYHMAGISVQLSDGRVSYADIDPKLLGRVMGCITPEEFSTIVDAIATAVENPQEQTYCQRRRNTEKEG